MKEAGITGKHIQIQNVIAPNIISKKNGIIGKNKFHEAIEIDSIVFDNLETKGVKLDDWLDDIDFHFNNKYKTQYINIFRMVKITSYTKREYIDYSLSELIELLKAKSIMFFGEEEKFDNLYFFIIGFLFHKNTSGKNVEEKFLFFDEWLYIKYDLKIRDNWRNIYNDLFTDESEKINTFYKDYQEFNKIER